MPRFLLARTPQGVFVIDPDSEITFMRPLIWRGVDVGVVNAAALVDAETPEDAISKFYEAFSELGNNEKSIGKLLQEMAGSICQLIGFSGGPDPDDEIRSAARRLAANAVAECLGVDPARMNDPDVLRRPISDFRGK